MTPKEIGQVLVLLSQEKYRQVVSVIESEGIFTKEEVRTQCEERFKARITLPPVFHSAREMRHCQAKPSGLVDIRCPSTPS